MGDYVVVVQTEKYGFCLHRVAGRSRERAEEVLKRCQEEEPDKVFKIDYVEKEDCWWYGNLD